MGKVAFITGAAGGIGRAVAARFAREGAHLVLADRGGDALSAATVELGENGTTVLAQAVDVTDAASIAAAVQSAITEFGGIDFLITCAGIEGVVAPLLDYPEDVFDQVIAVNLKGTWLSMRQVVPAMRGRAGATIVTVSSIAGLMGSPRAIAYSASKHGVIGLTRTAALELARDGIRVNAVCPAPIDTRMMRSLEAGYSPAHPDAFKERSIARTPLRRYGTPDEVAGLVTFLCGADASYITGAIYPVDGGYTA